MFRKIRKRLAEDRIRYHAVALVQAINEAGHKIIYENGTGLVWVFYHPKVGNRKAIIKVDRPNHFEYQIPIDFEVL